jgi:hypothetical protein
MLNLVPTIPLLPDLSRLLCFDIDGIAGAAAG